MYGTINFVDIVDTAITVLYRESILEDQFQLSYFEHFSSFVKKSSEKSGAVAVTFLE